MLWARQSRDPSSALLNFQSYMAQEAGDGPAEAAEGNTFVGELDHQRSYLGGWREVPGDVLVGNG